MVMYSSLPAKFYCNHLNSLSSLSHVHTHVRAHTHTHTHTHIHTNLFIVITKVTFVPSENPSKIDLQTTTTSLTPRAYKIYKENSPANTIIMYYCTAMHVLSRVCI